MPKLSEQEKIDIWWDKILDTSPYVSDKDVKAIEYQAKLLDSRGKITLANLKVIWRNW